MDFQEYPKWLPIGDGVIVWNKEEEDGLQEKTSEEVTEKKRGRPRKVVNDGNQ